MTLTLATFCRGAQQPASDWYPERGVREPRPGVGDPSRIGRAWAARLRNDSTEYSDIDLITYVTEQPGGYQVHLLARWRIWHPRTHHVTWSAARTWDMSGPPWPTHQAASFAASECAWGMASAYGQLVMALHQFSTDTFAPVLGWNGHPFAQDGH